MPPAPLRDLRVLGYNAEILRVPWITFSAAFIMKLMCSSIIVIVILTPVGSRTRLGINSRLLHGLKLPSPRRGEPPPLLSFVFLPPFPPTPTPGIPRLCKVSRSREAIPRGVSYQRPSVRLETPPPQVPAMTHDSEDAAAAVLTSQLRSPAPRLGPRIGTTSKKTSAPTSLLLRSLLLLGFS